MSPASTHTTDQAGTRSKHKTLPVLPGWPTATPTSVRIQRQNWPYRAPGRAEPVIHRQRRLSDRVPRRVEVEHAVLSLLRSQRSPSHTRRFVVGGRAMQIRGGSVIFDPLTGRLPWLCRFDKCPSRTPGHMIGARLPLFRSCESGMVSRIGVVTCGKARGSGDGACH
jgi:hypothetical protein